MKIKTYFILILSLITISTSCKKDKANKPVCRISKLINRYNKEIRISYNADGKPSRIEDDYFGETITTTYNNNAIVIARANSITGTRKSTTTMLLNTSGMVYSQRDEYYNTTGTKINSAVKNEFEYNGSEVIISTIVDSFHYSASVASATVSFVWAGGNLASITQGARTDKYEYFLDKAAQVGDLETLFKFIRGNDNNLLIKNKNLTKSKNAAQYTYDFDEEGKIKTAKYNGSVEFQVKYECR